MSPIILKTRRYAAETSVPLPPAPTKQARISQSEESTISGAAATSPPTLIFRSVDVRDTVSPERRNNDIDLGEISSDESEERVSKEMPAGWQGLNTQQCSYVYSLIASAQQFRRNASDAWAALDRIRRLPNLPRDNVSAIKDVQRTMVDRNRIAVDLLSPHHLTKAVVWNDRIALPDRMATPSFPIEHGMIPALGRDGWVPEGWTKTDEVKKETASL